MSLTVYPAIVRDKCMARRAITAFPRSAWEREKIVRTIVTKQAGKQFDPDLVAVFLQQWSAIQSICQQYTEES